jgi:hypothetical protein
MRGSSDLARPVRRGVTLAVAAASLAGIATYLVLSGCAGRPLTPPEAWSFGAAFARATPAHVAGRNPLVTLRLAGRAFGNPQRAVVLEADGRQYRIPLPPRTSFGPSDVPGQFITLATPEQLREHFHVTLPRAGWPYREQFGSMHVLGSDEVVLSISSTHYAGTRSGQIRVSVRAIPPPPEAMDTGAARPGAGARPAVPERV